MRAVAPEDHRAPTGLGQGDAIGKVRIAKARVVIKRIVDRMIDAAGLAFWTGGEGPLQLMERADAALYRAKRRGRDRTVLAIEEPARVAQRSSVVQD